MDQNTATIITGIIAIIAALLGAIVGGVGSYIASTRVEKNKLLREKCEAIYDTALQIKRWLENENARNWEHFDPNDPENVLKIKVEENLPCPTDKIILLVDLYVRQVEKEVKQFVQLVHNSNARYDYEEVTEEEIFSSLRDARESLQEESQAILARYQELVSALRNLSKKL